MKAALFFVNTDPTDPNFWQIIIIIIIVITIIIIVIIIIIIIIITSPRPGNTGLMSSGG